MGCVTAPEILEKTAAEIRLGNFEFAARLEVGETLSAVVSVTVAPPGELTATSPAVSGTRAQITLSAGTAPRDYAVTIRVTTNLGETLEGLGFVRVREP